MNVTVVTYSSSGGAGNVSRALVDGFNSLGVASELLVATDANLRTKPLSNPGLTTAAAVDSFVVKNKTWPHLISLRRDSHSSLRETLPKSDLTIFRWMNGLLGKRFLDENYGFDNLVWGLDDMNPFTGACHYSASCRQFESGCLACPAVRAPFRSTVSKNLLRKELFVSSYHPKFVAPTDWIQTEFEKSKLGRGQPVWKIPNPLERFFFGDTPFQKNIGKRLRLLVVAANLEDPTKGVWKVRETLSRMSTDGQWDVTLVGSYSSKMKAAFPGCSFLGRLNRLQVKEQMLHSDLLLVPSISENAGTVVAEAASQGLPSVARNVGGMPEMTNYGQTGFLFDGDDEVAEILASIDTAGLSQIGLAAREWAQELRPEIVAAKYITELT